MMADHLCLGRELELPQDPFYFKIFHRSPKYVLSLVINSSARRLEHGVIDMVYAGRVIAFFRFVDQRLGGFYVMDGFRLHLLLLPFVWAQR